MKRFGPRNRHEWRTGNVQRQQEHSTTEETTIRAVLPQAKGYLGLPEAIWGYQRQGWKSQGRASPREASEGLQQLTFRLPSSA